MLLWKDRIHGSVEAKGSCWCFQPCTDTLPECPVVGSGIHLFYVFPQCQSFSACQASSSQHPAFQPFWGEYAKKWRDQRNSEQRMQLSAMQSAGHQQQRCSVLQMLLIRNGHDASEREPEQGIAVLKRRKFRSSAVQFQGFLFLWNGPLRIKGLPTFRKQGVEEVFVSAHSKEYADDGHSICASFVV